MRIIIDTGPWSEFFRRATRPPTGAAVEVARVVRADAVQMIGPIRQELLSGAKPSDRFEQLRAHLRFFPNIRLDYEDDERAAEFYNVCRQHGIQGTSTDLLICALAARHHFKIYSLDTDFLHYAKHLPIRLHKPVPG